MANRSNYTDRMRKIFLNVLRQSANVSESARAAGISRRSAYDYKRDNEEFKEQWDEAVAEAIDALENVAWTRAASGESDRMLELLLKAHRPQKYKDRVYNEMTGKDGGPIETASTFTAMVIKEIDGKTRSK